MTAHQTAEFDVVIIGGGPAGTAAGLTLLKRDGLRVAVVEASDYSQSRPGESLTPGIRPLLDYLKLWEAFRTQQSLETFGTEAMWGSTAVRSLDYMFTVHGNGWLLNRLAFDRLLASQFEERGGCLMRQTVLDSLHPNATGGWQVECRSSDGDDGLPSHRQTLQARFIIDASGRQHHVARQLGIVRTVHDRLTGSAAVASLPDGVEMQSRLRVEAGENGWWYVAPLPNRQVVAVFMTDADLAADLRVSHQSSWQQLFATTQLHRDLPLEASAFGSVRIFCSASGCLPQMGGSNWVVVGDAAAAHDPLSSTGIPHAVGSGIHGALVAADTLFGEGAYLASYQESMQNDFREYLSTRARYYASETRWPDATFWRRRRDRVTLNPYSEIRSTADDQTSPDSRSPHVTAQLMRFIQQASEHPVPAHQLVRRISSMGGGYSDERIILAVQQLVAEGELQESRSEERTAAAANSTAM